ncbi:amino acid ABC transporter substrate-binding protein [Pectinatus frisingensis]|jgi:polar amino acid transport system substrate-binding protein|uniref:amino acid ABC transporter substrate-binding protein n=1 Tax=Pectinatus frisingensis TaxID=865 RepID=UPI0015F5FBD6|nr:amino acid ABC transporter substrate-binding protein [Pectinatus frisingensis]
MKRIILSCLLIAASALLIAGCGQKNQPVSSGSGDTGGKIIVGLDDNYPPMGFRDENNEITGFDVDLAKEAAKRLNREVEFKPIDWSSKEAELKSGRVNVLWNGLDITEKRKENMLFSDPYMDNRQIVFVKKDSDIKTIDDLKGKVVGTQSGSTGEENINKDQNLKNSFKEVKSYPDYIAAFMDLENGRIDAIIGDEITGRYYMNKHPDKFAARDIVIGETTSFGIGFAKDNQKLRDEVQKVLDAMKKDGTMAKISEKWFGKDITK